MAIVAPFALNIDHAPAPAFKRGVSCGLKDHGGSSIPVTSVMTSAPLLDTLGETGRDLVSGRVLARRGDLVAPCGERRKIRVLAVATA